MSLHEKYITLSKYGLFNDEKIYGVDHITKNINQQFELRPYQKEAYVRFQHYLNEKQKNNTNTHLLFNMATGSGKTLVMAMFILDLYEKGYRNFLFFVNSINIVEKTKQNFINSSSSKYLFADKIMIDNKVVNIKTVDNFESVNQDDINICFTTIQGLSSTLTIEKENSITYDDFKDKKIVLLADEAHHLNSNTKSSKKELELLNSWEFLIMKVFNQNKENIFLEFTATVPQSEEVQKKYEDKRIYKYDLKEFRNDKFSKELKLIQTDASLEDKMLIACLMNYYRSKIASDNGLSIKPVILFKSETTKNSEINHQLFNNMIDDLNKKKIKTILDMDILSMLKKYIQNKNITTDSIITSLKHTFNDNHLINMNNEVEKNKNQLLVNSLEDTNNPISGIFAVEKLNEGWDVLNLYDIVRCYTTKTDSKETTREAQLIGRGARYYPFSINDNQDKYMRKYDNDLKNPLRILEVFYYHAQDESTYITNLTNSLVNEGLLDEKPKVEKIMKLKETFTNTDIYANGKILINDCIKKGNGIFNTKRFNELTSVRAPILLSQVRLNPQGKEIILLDNEYNTAINENTNIVNCKLSDLGSLIVRKALSKNKFYVYNDIKKMIPNLKSINEFITDYLSKIKIEFTCDIELSKIPSSVKLSLINDVLEKLELEIKKEFAEKEGSIFKEKLLSEIFKKEIIKLVETDKDDNRTRLENKDWYVYDTSFLTSEELNFERLFTKFIEKMEHKYNNIYLLRNERLFAIYNTKGKRFEPDFVIICSNADQTDGEILYQCFIEPKGEHLQDYDRWKENFLINDLSNELVIIEDRKYKLIGMPFYNRADENEFEKQLSEAYNLDNT